MGDPVGQTGIDKFMQNAPDPLAKIYSEGAQAYGDAIVAAFDALMTKAVNEGGLLEVAKNVTKPIANLGGAIAERATSDFSAFSHRPSSSSEPSQEQVVAKAVEGPSTQHEQKMTELASSAGAIGIPQQEPVHFADKHAIGYGAVAGMAGATVQTNDVSLQRT